LAHGQSTLINPLICDDTLATASALEAFGVSIQKENGQWRVTGCQWRAPDGLLDCGESATTYRFLKAITQSLKIPCTLTGRPSLMKRMAAGNLTSQFLSGEILAGSNLSTESLVSKPYVNLTIDIQKKFGGKIYRPTTLEIEGDWSSAAFLLAIGILHKEVVLEGLNPDSLQGDRAIFDILKEMGGDIFWDGEKLVARPSKLRAIAWDFSQTPDLYPIVAVLCARAGGKSNLTGTERLAFKESNRVKEMSKITTGYHVPGGNFVVDSTDHRIVMAAAVLNLATGGQMVIKNPQCVAKSWPGFWEILTTLSLPSPLEGEG